MNTKKEATPQCLGEQGGTVVYQADQSNAFIFFFCNTILQFWFPKLNLSVLIAFSCYDSSTLSANECLQHLLFPFILVASKEPYFKGLRIGCSKGSLCQVAVELHGDDVETLLFEARFESGNLEKAVKV